MRLWLLRLHRWTGLTIALVLFVAGATGIPLAFYRQLDGMLNGRSARRVVPHGTVRPTDAVIALAEAQNPGYMATGICFCETQQPDEPLMVRLQLRGAAPDASWANRLYVYLDPYRGVEVDRNAFRNNANQTSAVLPFLVRLHSGMLFGATGFRLYGVVAVLWTLDCFVALLVSLPASRSRHQQGASPARWRRWRHAWRVKWSARPTRVNFDVHRALGLWTWPAMFVFAWSSVGLNLDDQVYRPVMKTLFGQTAQNAATSLPAAALLPPTTPPGIGWADALTTARGHMARIAAEEHFSVTHEYSLLLTGGDYSFSVHSSRDIGRTPGTSLTFDATTGALRAFHVSGRESTADSISRWLRALHFGTPFGLAYQTVVAIMGVALCIIVASGVLIWAKKRALVWTPRRERGRRATGDEAEPDHCQQSGSARQG